MIKDNYLYNIEYSDINFFQPEKDSIYIYGYSTEGRSHSVDDIIKKYEREVNFVKIEDIGNDKFIDLTSKKEYNLRSSDSVLSFFSEYETNLFYIDVTGLNNRISASLLKNTLTQSLKNSFPEIRVIYSEPNTYKVERFKQEGVFNDLSEQISGIEPLPGFASIFPDDDIENVIFVALLGFEGGRFSHVIENTQPQKDTIIPVIGVPGFRMEYPYVAYWGNRRPIEDTDAWRNIRYVAANSIVDSYIFLSKLKSKFPGKKIKVAPIGTKPHAIGAIIFATKYFDNVELVYDNPIRKKKRTKGIGKIVECKACKLIKEK